MSESPKIYVYKMTYDTGGAPCVHRRVLTLALCKPKIRKVAKEGSLVIGFGGQRLGGRLIYAAYVTGKPPLGDYYRKARYHGRPDCIYRDTGGRPRRLKNAEFHSESDQSKTDVGRHFEKAYVLVSNSFRYFGRDGNTDYRTRYKRIAMMLDRLTQGHRVNHDPRLREELLLLVKELWRTPAKTGVPSDSDTTRRCNTATPSMEC